MLTLKIINAKKHAAHQQLLSFNSSISTLSTYITSSVSLNIDAFTLVVKLNTYLELKHQRYTILPCAPSQTEHHRDR